MARTEYTRTLKLIVDTTPFTYVELARAAGCSPENIRRACENYGEDLSIDKAEAIAHYLSAHGEMRHLDALNRRPNGASANGTLDDEISDMVRYLTHVDDALSTSNFGDARTAIEAMEHVMERIQAEYEYAIQ